MPNPFATGALLYVRGYTVVARTLRAEQHAVAAGLCHVAGTEGHLTSPLNDSSLSRRRSLAAVAHSNS
jgi:hypothetical protein